ncbi:hypothetical protein Acor_16530 [Acrocarpospora corrugata]|uniref:Uncharacterized protein n=1 Tax=Acrocarpospora corrugata TaxID=35763 RepID=A0A5M3VUL7_9ACTN|nr:type II toxin-antitoxin system ParD family antitoxin [Acrocarpospora corrugata]GER99589.1 hypothetical protein Acor_16530 [Acrocarpospora corrugata]
MTTKPVTVTIDEHLHAYAQEEVKAGRAKSVSSVVNAALAARAEADHAADAAVRKAVAAVQADPEVAARVERMTAHVLAQATSADRTDLDV